MRWLPLCLACASLGACSLEPAYVRPAPVIPRDWPTIDGRVPTAAAPPPALTYRDLFRDPKLQKIIAQALAANQDLRQALANVAAARGLYRIQRAAVLPTVEADLGATTRTTHSASGQVDGAATSFDLQAGTTAWEVDLFGRLRSLKHAAFDQYLASKAASGAARLTLVAAVVDAYLTLAADRSLLRIAADTETSGQATVDLTRLRLDGGVAPRIEFRQAQTVLATAQADHARQITLVAQDRNALELLAGGAVDADALPDQIESAGSMVGELPAGLNTTVLLQRPDVVEADYVLRAANARIGAARAAFFPRISLTSLVGLSSGALASLVAGSALTATVAPAVSIPIFDAGANRGNLAYARAQRDLYAAAYEKAVQTAFREAADGLALRATIDRQIAADMMNLTAAQDVFTLEVKRYREGLDPYLATLDAQRSLYSAQILMVDVQLARSQNLVALYKALGGDSVDHGEYSP